MSPLDKAKRIGQFTMSKLTTQLCLLKKIVIMFVKGKNNCNR